MRESKLDEEFRVHITLQMVTSLLLCNACVSVLLNTTYLFRIQILSLGGVLAVVSGSACQCHALPGLL